MNHQESDWGEIYCSNVSKSSVAFVELFLMASGAAGIVEKYPTVDKLTQQSKEENIDLARLMDREKSLGIFAYLPIEKAQRVAEELSFLLKKQIRKKCTVSVKKIAPLQWEKIWQSHFIPIVISKKLIVSAPWHEQGQNPDLQPVVIDPGMAFGTGHHATTRMCLEFLSELLESPLPASAMRVLDLGCGSGILSISAALLGGREIVAVDIDEFAVTATRLNAVQNGVASKLRIYKGSLDRTVATFDLILANLFEHTLLELKSSFPRKLKAEGKFIVSGITLSQTEKIISAFEGEGLLLKCKKEMQNWACLLFEHKRA